MNVVMQHLTTHRMPENKRAFRDGMRMLAHTQSQLPFPPNNLQASVLVNFIIEESGLQYDSRKEYFFKLAKCALLGREPMYRNFINLKKEKHK